MYKKVFNFIKAHTNLVTVTIVSLALGFLFLYTLPEPANAILFIAFICVIFYYVVQRTYKGRNK